jgi:putative transposase
VSKQYQNRGTDASELVVPERVSVVMAGIAESAAEGLLAVAVGAGLQVVAALMAESVTALAGPRGRQDPDRSAVRHGTGPGSVTLGAAGGGASASGAGHRRLC